MNEFEKEKAKADSLKWVINDLLDSNYTQYGYDEIRALKDIISYAKQRIDDLECLLNY